MKCPDCGKEIFCSSICCPNCGKRLVNYFTAQCFLRENFHLFTILGVIGTMIALLPNLGEKIIGPNWISGNWGFLSYFLVLLNYGGGLFLLIIFAVLLIKIIDSRGVEETIFDWKLLEIKRGDINRIPIAISLLAMLVGSFYFVFFATMITPYRPATIFSVVIIIVISLIVVLIPYIFAIVEIKRAGRFQFEKLPEAIFVICALIFFMYFSLFPILNSVTEPQLPHDVFIKTDQMYP